ncbi:MAG: hypothetical protein AAGA25_05020 [Planctomycetota bacterium]
MNTGIGVVVLAQEATETPWWHIIIEQAFGLTIVLIFLVALVSVLVNQWRKDKCLKLLNRYHATYMNKNGRSMWGDLIVYSKGLELVFDAPYTSSRGLRKTSSLIYPKQMEDCVAVARIAERLAHRESRRRMKQIRRSFRPGPIRKTRRSFQNLINTFRDAFSKALTAFIGQIAAHTQNESITSNQGHVQELGDDLLGAAANAFEPLLERHIGQPVVAEVQYPGAQAGERIDIPGYLVDYSDKFLAIFNVKHEPIETLQLTVEGQSEHEGFTASWVDGRFTLTCNGPDLIVLRSLHAKEVFGQPDAVLIRGTHLSLNLPSDTPPTIEIARTRRVDLVCAREHATIRYGGEYAAGDKRQAESKPQGVAPGEIED